MAKFRACRVTYEGFRYQVNGDGSVLGQVDRTLPITAEGNASPVIDEAVAKAVRDEAARQRRNRNARARNEAMRDLGMRRTAYGWE